MTIAAEIIQNFLFKIDPSATYPREEILEKFVCRLNEERPSSQKRPYCTALVAMRMRDSGINNAALLCWFYSYCDELAHGKPKAFSELWFQFLDTPAQDISRPVTQNPYRCIAGTQMSK